MRLTQEQLNRPRDVDLRFRASLRPQLALWLFGIEISPVFLREPWKAVAAGNKKRDLSTSNANAKNATAFERQSVVGSEAVTSRESWHIAVSKRKAEEISSSDGPSEPSSRRSAPGHLFGDGLATQGSTG